MQETVEAALNFIDKVNQVRDPKELIRDFSTVIRLFGFKNYIMTGLPSYGEDVEKLIVSNAWPIEWTDRYRANQYFYDDPVSQWAFSSSRAFTWKDARAKSSSTRSALEIEAEAKSIGLVDGVGFPTFDPHNWQAVISLSADCVVDLSPREMAVLNAVASICHGHAAQLGNGKALNVALLTPRERDILTWMAHGKTRWEVATILGISESTTKNYLAQIALKLDASSTMHAVAKAVHSRQIRL